MDIYFLILLINIVLDFLFVKFVELVCIFIGEENIVDFNDVEDDNIVVLYLI